MKRRNIIIILVISLLIVFGIIGAVYFLNKPSQKQPDKVITATKVDKIEGFSYTLDDRDSKLFKENFKELKTVLESDPIDYNKYASILSKLYIIDLYTINNKINQYDVGSLEYVHPDGKENFELKVKDTIYRFVEDNTYGKRNQKLPIVKSVEITRIEEKKQKVKDLEYDGYEIEIKWDYEEELGYDKETTLSIIKLDNLLYIINHKNENTLNE